MHIKVSSKQHYPWLEETKWKVNYTDTWGHVGMPIAVEFAKHVKVIGFNHNERRIQQYKSGIDSTNEVGNEVISKTTVDFTSDEKRLSEAKFIISM